MKDISNKNKVNIFVFSYVCKSVFCDNWYGGSKVYFFLPVANWSQIRDKLLMKLVWRSCWFRDCASANRSANAYKSVCWSFFCFNFIRFWFLDAFYTPVEVDFLSLQEQDEFGLRFSLGISPVRLKLSVLTEISPWVVDKFIFIDP